MKREQWGKFQPKGIVAKTFVHGLKTLPKVTVTRKTYLQVPDAVGDRCRETGRRHREIWAKRPSWPLSLISEWSKRS